MFLWEFQFLAVYVVSKVNASCDIPFFNVLITCLAHVNGLVFTPTFFSVPSRILKFMSVPYSDGNPHIGSGG